MWEKALVKFLESWEQEEYVIAAVATGSYVVGNNTYKSDIDVHIILADEVDWRERGNKYVDGYLIEYFANPIKQIYQYLDEGLKDGDRIDANMFTIGKVIFDKSGVTTDLKMRAKDDLLKPFKELDQATLEITRYLIWDYFEEVEECYKTESPNYNYLYYLYLQKLLDGYARYLRTPLPGNYKVYKFFKDEGYRRKYGISDFPDNEFKVKFLKCLEHKDRVDGYNEIHALKDYVLGKMGGFEVDGWKFKSPLMIKEKK